VSAVDLARLQFATTSIYHFLFVPLTIGLAFLTALLQTSWHRSQRPEYLRLTRFFGTLLVINIAVGVVTGLVQEFQFGMNWSVYSRFVGDVFGAPLAIEGLAAFFLESTFLGLWLFGWDRLPRRVHLATIWAVAVGAALSAAFIMAANSWMQRPVGYQLNATDGFVTTAIDLAASGDGWRSGKACRCDRHSDLRAGACGAPSPGRRGGKLGGAGRGHYARCLSGDRRLAAAIYRLAGAGAQRGPGAS